MVDLRELEPLDLPQRAAQPRGDNLHRPGGGVGGHPGTVPSRGKLQHNSPA
jgi:hypothetical protein